MYINFAIYIFIPHKYEFLLFRSWTRCLFIQMGAFCDIAWINKRRAFQNSILYELLPRGNFVMMLLIVFLHVRIDENFFKPNVVTKYDAPYSVCVQSALVWSRNRIFFAKSPLTASSHVFLSSVLMCLAYLIRIGLPVLKHESTAFTAYFSLTYSVEKIWTYLRSTLKEQTNIIYFNPHKLQITDHICYSNLGL